MFRMCGEQIRLQVQPKLFRVNRWIVQMIRQWIPSCWSGDRKCTSLKSAAANSRNWQLMTSDRSQMLATRNFGDWHTVVGEVPWSSVAKTTMDCHSKLVLQVVMHQLRQIMLIFPIWSISVWWDVKPYSINQSPTPVTRRAAAFWTCWNLSVTFGAEDKTELRQLQEN